MHGGAYDKLRARGAMITKNGRDLGMEREITRRDFLNGFALAAGAALVPDAFFGAFDFGSNPEKASSYYPPAQIGMRGDHPGSYEAAHSLRDATFWKKAGKPQDTHESYDLVIVGGGISGLSAAHYFRKAAGPNARILIIENHDDFGGHAKRNEFNVGKAFRLGYGGTESIESPAPYSKVAKGLVEELGVDVSSYRKFLQKEIYSSRGLKEGVFFDKETFGADRLVSVRAREEQGNRSVLAQVLSEEFLAQAPLSDVVKKDLLRLAREEKDYFPGLSSAEKKAKLARISYADYLTKIVGADPGVLKVFQTFPHGLYGVGIDAVPAQDAWGFDMPGFAGLKLDPAPGKGMNRDSIPNDEAEAYFFHFPDGNATMARLLVRSLIPGSIPGKTVHDILLARAEYSRLDEAASPVRIRLNSTAVRVRHLGDAKSAKEVEVAYARGGKVFTVRAANCVLACWHAVIPYICKGFPDAQKTALSSAAKVPIVYTNVLLRDWKAFAKLGISTVTAPGSYFSGFNLDLPVNYGRYQCAQSPAEPVVVHMLRTPCSPGLPARDQHVAGRTELYTTSFDTFERNIRDQLGRALAGGGFDPARDIAAITVNRWPHGYAYQYNSLWDDFWRDGSEQPCHIARKPFGRIVIANADADAYAYMDCAIDQAYRAVLELRARA
jgi:spermidine dehydrogenase